MLYITKIFSFLLLVYTTTLYTYCSPDIAKLEDDQKILLDTLRENKDFDKDLRQKLKFMDKNNDVKSLNYVSSTIPVENDANSLKVETNYTPPIIVLLPEDSSSREKWEYAVTLKCLGKKSFDAFTNIHNTRMAKMASISGTTVAEINSEIKETEQELENVRKELESVKEKKKNTKTHGKEDYAEKTRMLHIDHNIKLLNQEIHVMEIMLERLKKRLKSAILFGRKTDTDSGVEDKDEYGENEESDDNGDTSRGGEPDDEYGDEEGFD